MNLEEIKNNCFQFLSITINDIVPIKETGLNYVYKIKCENVDYVLKIYRKIINFHNSNTLINYLNSNNILTINTLFEFEVGSFIYKIYSFIDGKHIFHYNKNEINIITEILAVLYNNRVSPSEITILDKIDGYFSFLLSKKDKVISDDIYNILYSTYKRLNFQKDKFILVHGDLSSTNLIWTQTVNIIDFDESIAAPKEYEICSCIIKNSFDNNYFDIEQAKKIMHSLKSKININYIDFRHAWDLYIIKVIVEKLFYFEQTEKKQKSKELGHDHWSYWYKLLFNESIVSELFNYSIIETDNLIRTSVFKSDNKSNVTIVTDSKNKYVEKIEFVSDEKMAKDEYNVVNILYNYGLNDLFLYNLIIQENKTIKYFSFLDGLTKKNLSDSDLKEIVSKLYKIYDFLLKYSNDSLDNEHGDIRQKLYDFLDVLKETKYAEVIINLINDVSFFDYLDNQKKIIILDDLHRDNIIFNKDGTIAFIDFTGLKKYPQDYQLASLIVNLMMLYDDNRIDFVISNWPIKIDINQLNKLIKYRIIKGIAYYEKNLQKLKKETYDKKVNFLRKRLDNMIK